MFYETMQKGGWVWAASSYLPISSLPIPGVREVGAKS